MGMTSEERARCEDIIHGHALTAAAANAAAFAPGTSVAIDTGILISMAMDLARVFGGSLRKSAAEALAVDSLKQTVGRSLIKELATFIPGGKLIVGPVVTLGMIEKAGWAIANQLTNQRG